MNRSEDLGSGSTAVPVSAHIESLTPETKYHYRLVAENGAPVPSATPDQEFFTGPLLGGEFVDDVTADSATLRDTVDPNGADTHYYVEYGLTNEYGSYAPVSIPGVDLGSAAGVQGLSVHLQALEPENTYHYRFVAVQDGEVFPEGDHSFTTQSASTASGLLDGRAWELVSPPNKKGALLELTELGGQVQAANNGSGITYIGEGASIDPEAKGKLKYSQILSQRGPAGWQSSDITLPGRLLENEAPAETLFNESFNYHLFSPDLSTAAVEPESFGTPPLSPGVSERTLYLRDNINGSFSPLASAADIPEGTKIDEPESFGTQGAEWQMKFLTASPDLSHIVFKTPAALTPEAFDEETVKGNIEDHEIGDITVQWNLYEWSESGLKLVNILPVAWRWCCAWSPQKWCSACQACRYD